MLTEREAKIYLEVQGRCEDRLYDIAEEYCKAYKEFHGKLIWQVTGFPIGTFYPETNGWVSIRLEDRDGDTSSIEVPFRALWSDGWLNEIKARWQENKEKEEAAKREGVEKARLAAETAERELYERLKQKYD